MNKMKLYACIIFTGIFICAGSAVPLAAAPGDAGTGIMTWYSWWNPVWQNYTKYEEEVKFELDPGFITGPVVSYQLDAVTSISAVFLYWKYDTADTLTIGSADYEFQRDVHKTESDILVNKQVNSWLKWFFGMKYQGYFYSETETFKSGAVELPIKRDVSFHNLGPGAGFGTTTHVLGNLYFLNNLSVITLFGYERTEKVEFTYSLGGNVTTSLAYILPYNITMILGARFQHLQYLYHGNDRYASGNNWKRYDQLYGVTLTVMGSF